MHLSTISHVVFLEHRSATQSLPNIKTTAVSLPYGRMSEVCSSTHTILQNLAFRLVVPTSSYNVPHGPVGIAYCSSNVATLSKLYALAHVIPSA